MKKSSKFVTALLLSSALVCAAIPNQSLQAQTISCTPNGTYSKKENRDAFCMHHGFST